MNNYLIKGFMSERMLDEFVGMIEQYSDVAKKMIWDEICSTLDSLDEELSQIKSPIEQAFFIAMKGHMPYLENRAGIRAVALTPQEQIKTEKNTYYVDLGIGVMFSDWSTINYAIECDGHEFHEKTKEQARRDKQRERAITAAGFTVVRFTGSEIYEDPYKCAEEVYSLVLAEIRKRTEVVK